MQSSLKTNLFIAQGASSELSDEILLHFMKLVILILQAAKMETLFRAKDALRRNNLKHSDKFAFIFFLENEETVQLWEIKTH